MGDQPQPPSQKPLSEVELRYYYFGFHRVLRRYRTVTMVGWVVVLIGCVSFPVGWNIGRLGGIVDIALSCATIVAGLALVSQSVSSLESYLKIGLPSIHNGEQHTVVHEVAAVMKDVDDGGWREAFAAIEKIEELGKQHGLPPLH